MSNCDVHIAFFDHQPVGAASKQKKLYPERSNNVLDAIECYDPVLLIGVRLLPDDVTELDQIVCNFVATQRLNLLGKGVFAKILQIQFGLGLVGLVGRNTVGLDSLLPLFM